MPSSRLGLGLRNITSTGDNNTQARWPGCFSGFGGFPTMPYYPSYGSMMGYYPPALGQTAYQGPPPPEASPAQTSIRYSANVLPRPTGISTPSNDTPAEPPVRMRYIELSVTGIQDAGDGMKLTAALDKMKGSRGATVKRKAGGEATVKVWYSEKDPLDADAVVEAVSKLGFKAVPAG